MYRFYVVVGILLLASVQGVLAAGEAPIVISEIGAFEKTGEEWIEIYNRSAAEVDIAGWKFWEGGVNHGLAFDEDTSSTLAAGAFAVIAQDVVAFRLLHGDVPLLIDSSWGTLKEEGEEIGLKNAEGNVLEQFVYIAAASSSLQRVDVMQDVYDASNWQLHATGHSAGLANEFLVPEEEPILEEEIIIEEPVIEEEPIEEQEVPTSHIYISEFFSYPGTDQQEWIELYNPTSSSVSLEGWTLRDGIAEIAAPTSSIASSSFFCITLSRSALNNSGDKLALISPKGEIIDEVVFGEWEEEVAHVAAPGKTRAAARENNTGAFSITVTPTPNETNRITAPPVDPPHPAPDATARRSSSSRKAMQEVRIGTTNLQPGSILINELVSDPVDEQEEFIELYNTLDLRVDLTGWWIQDGSGTKTLFGKEASEPDVIAVRAFFVVNKPKGSLNNAGDQVTLFDPDGREIDTVRYGTWGDDPTKNAPRAEDPYSLAREKDNFVLTSEPTPGAANKIVFSKKVIDLSPIQITEILPNPKGSDDEEYIQLYNSGDVSIDLFGAVLDDAEGGSRPYRFPENTLIEPEQYKIFVREETGLALNNTTDEVRLFSESEKIIQQVVYEGAEEAAIYVLKSGEWQWMLAVPPQEEEEIETPEPKQKVEPQMQSQVLEAIAEVQDLEVGDDVSLSGMVSVPPGVLGSQYFYIIDPTCEDEAIGCAGIQVYMHSRKFPKLHEGDLVFLTGELAEAYEERRLKIRQSEDIVVVDHMQLPEPIDVPIAEIVEQHSGLLIHVSGDVTEKKGEYLYLDDGLAELRVSMQKLSKSLRSSIRAEQALEVTGILAWRRGEFVLLPRRDEDILLVAQEELPDQKSNIQVSSDQGTNSAVQQTSTAGAKTYMGMTAGGITSALIGWVLRSRIKR